MSTDLWVAGFAAAIAAWVELLPARQDPHRVVRWGEEARAARTGAREADVREKSVRRPRRLLVRAVRDDPPDLRLVLIDVSMLLRMGLPPAQAWDRALDRAGLARTDPPKGERGVLADTGPTSGIRAREGPEEAEEKVEEPEEVCVVAAPGVTTHGVPAALEALAQPPDPWRWVLLRHPGAALSRLRARHDPRMVGMRAAAVSAVAACRLSYALGAPLADILERAAQGVAEAASSEASRRAALAGPRATARLLAVLPLVGLLLGTLVGADPPAVLTDGGMGSLLGFVGIALMVLGHILTARFVREAEGEREELDEAFLADLAAAALTSGAAIPGVLEALGQAVGDEDLSVVSRALLLGARWEAAWRAPSTPGWREQHAGLESCLRPGWEDGAGVAPLLGAWAGAHREGRSARDEEAAGRLAVRLVLPLGLCHLPAFIILGIVPVILSVGGSMLT